MTTETEINWKAVDRVAARLGAHTRALVAAGDTEEALDWALRMASQHGGATEGNWPRAASYLELAALLEPRLAVDEQEVDDEPSCDACGHPWGAHSQGGMCAGDDTGSECSCAMIPPPGQEGVGDDA